MAETTLRGRLVWHELMTTDPKAAEPFYAGVVGWSTAPFEGIGMPYTMWMRGEMPEGGLMVLTEQERQAGVPPNWLMYVGTPDVDATAREAETLGGRVVVPPTDIPNVGRFAVIADPQGAVFAVHASANPSPAPDAPPQVGQFSWHELATSDSEAALAFYGRLFGWTLTRTEDLGALGPYRMFGDGGFTFGGMFTMPPDMGVPPNWLLYVRVPDIQRAADEVRARGGQVLTGPHEVPGGDWVAKCLDPQGAAFALHQRKA
jgi:predicted enzyme related to lactoylglutathione lyase